jgi:hypothetical protein
MVAYGLNISQVMAWSMPQLRLLARYRDMRERNDRRWQLALASGTMAEEAAETLWAQLAGDDVQMASSGGSTQSTSSSRQSHMVDSKGNVIARGAPLLSDIALGKVPAPLVLGRPFPITTVGRNKQEETDA